jgi:copper homeostasis protein
LILEVCVDDLAGLTAAIEGGADRIELCSALSLGGLTPSAGLMQAATKMNIACYAMIRPRAGDFVYSANEIDVMARDMKAARDAGLAGVVFGANLQDGRLDAAALATLCRHADGLSKTLHRAFDLVPDLDEAVRLAVELGFDRILTSGRAVTALQGLHDLESAHNLSAGRISIMPGSGITADNVDVLLGAAPFTEVHASCSSSVADLDSKLSHFGFAAANQRKTDVNQVTRLRRRLDKN